MHTAQVTAQMAYQATLDTIPSPATATRQERAMKTLLTLVAVCQTVATLSIWPVFFINLSELEGFNPERWITTAVIAVSPLVAIAALVLTLTRRPRGAIVAIASVSLLDWSRTLPKIVNNGFELFPAIQDQVQFYVFPMLCFAAIVLAARNTRPVAATLMATAPSVLNGLFWITFFVVVSIYGF